MSGSKNKLIAFNYFGGKFTWLDNLYQHFPRHKHFVDVFCGSMVVTLNKERSLIDTANDINGDVVNFFKVLREKPDQLIHKLMLTPVSREEYNNAYYSQGLQVDDVERARMFFVRARQSFYGLGAQRLNKGWHLAKTHTGAKYGETVSKWINAIDKLDAIISRLSTIQLENKHYRDIIRAIDFPEAFFYLDAPYPEQIRKSKNDYKYDFTDDDHVELAYEANKCTGKVMISSYECDLMDTLYPKHDWMKVKFPVKKNNIRSGLVQECIYMNYEPSDYIKPLAIQTKLHLTT